MVWKECYRGGVVMESINCIICLVTSLLGDHSNLWKSQLWKLLQDLDVKLVTRSAAGRVRQYTLYVVAYNVFCKNFWIFQY